MEHYIYTGTYRMVLVLYLIEYSIESVLYSIYSYYYHRVLNQLRLSAKEAGQAGRQSTRLVPGYLVLYLGDPGADS